MSDVDISAEAVERLARELRRSIGQHEDVRRDAAATLRALRAALDAAETDLAITLADLDNSGATSLEIAAERDAALAALDAAWRAQVAFRDAVVAIADDFQPDNDAQAPQALAEMRDALHALLAGTVTIAPPADLAAEAPGDAVAKRPACPHSRVDCGIGQLMTDPPLRYPVWTCDMPDCSLAIRARAGA